MALIIVWSGFKILDPSRLAGIMIIILLNRIKKSVFPAGWMPKILFILFILSKKELNSYIPVNISYMCHV
jgi:hypothetical protein